MKIYFFIVLSVLFTGSIYAQELEGSLRLNQIQIIGSHNSYKQKLDNDLYNKLLKRDSIKFKGLDYSHIPLSQQLDLGLRQLEIDVYADVNGGKYAHPLGLKMTGSSASPYDTNHVMNEKGFKVLHVQDIDFRSSCLRLLDCLNELKFWSDAHPDHLPIFITFNTKMDTIKLPGFVQPEAFIKDVFDLLDQELIKGLSIDKIITPDQIRAGQETLVKAIKTKGWPILNELKGKFVLILDEGDARRKVYLGLHPNLQNGILFTTPEDQFASDAAIMIINDPVTQFDKIQAMIKAGFIVRTRADSDTWMARNGDYSNFKKATSSGAQIISTDYYIKSQTFKSDFEIYFEGHVYQRKNPILN